MHAEDGVEIAVVHNGVHVDLVLPLTSKSFDWLKTIRPKHFVMDQDNLSFALFGWGNRQFYLETPQWKDLKVTTVLIAMAGQGRTVMHVDKRSQLPKASDKCRRIRITTDQYQRLCSHIHSSFEVEASGEFRPIPGAHYRDVDAFYEAAGSYHLFNTCNVWAGNALRLAGVRIGWWTPTTSGVFACLPDNAPDESNK